MFRNSFPIIYARNLAASLVFYRDRLGFAETYRFPPAGGGIDGEGGGEPEFVALRLADGSSLALAAVTEGQAGAHGQQIRLDAGRQFELCLYTDDTDDVDRAVAELRGHGVPVLVEPAEQPWGERMAYVADPDGHPVMICALLSS